MTRAFLLLLFIGGVAVTPIHATTNKRPRSHQAFTAVFWTETTVHSPAGKPFTYVQRTVHTRDQFGNVRSEVYKQTPGVQHDTTAPLQNVLTGSSAAQILPAHVRSSKDVTEKDDDLGTRQFAGLLATGTRLTFQDASGHSTHTSETWFSPALGLIVHMENSDARGNTVTKDLSEWNYGEISPSAAEAPSATPAVVPPLTLYRTLFTHVAHMERDRLINDPNRHVNMTEIEEHLRTKIGLSKDQWRVLVEKSVTVEHYIGETAQQARAFAVQDRAARRANPLSANSVAFGRATLHKMQLEMNTRVQADVDQLNGRIGAEASEHIQTYLQGTLTLATSVVPLDASKLRTQKEQVR